MSSPDKKLANWDQLVGLSEEAIEQKAQEFLSLMTLKEKAYQMSGDKSLITGGIRELIRYNSRPLPAGRNKRLGIPPMLFVDGPRGVVMNTSTCFPVSMARGAAWDVNLEERVGNAIGIEARAQGANFFGGVCINLLRHPSWGRAQETYGEDPFHLGEMGAALVRGTQQHVMGCAKHFACNSMENARFKVDVQVDERTLREVYLPHFKRCVDQGVASIMSAYNQVNGEYCGHNAHLLLDILKNDWDFKGFVISDFLLGVRSGKKGVRGGLDIEMPLRWRMKAKKLVKLVEKGEITEQMIDEAVLRILRQKLRFNRQYNQDLYTREKVACQDHIQLALEAARKGMVLLKNEDGLLPIDRQTVKKIAVVGRLADYPNIGDLGSSRVYPPYVITPYEGIRKCAGDGIEVVIEPGKDLETAKSLAIEADITIIVAGFTHKEEGEYIISKGGDRENLGLGGTDEKYIHEIVAATPKCVVIIEAGSAVIVEPWESEVPAIVMAWYPGMEGGTALGELLFGDANFTGKLPLSVPKSPEQLPFFDKKAKEITYGYYHGYRLMDKEGYTPNFPFGHGLSYTTFSYAQPRASAETFSKDGSIEVSVDVTNTGDRVGEEIVQLYARYEKSAVERFSKELKGFASVSLAPGETKTVTIAVGAKNLGYYSIEKKTWVVEAIPLTFLIGPSSREENLLAVKSRIE